jgi:hypothetical protein
MFVSSINEAADGQGVRFGESESGESSRDAGEALVTKQDRHKDVTTRAVSSRFTPHHSRLDIYNSRSFTTTTTFIMLIP